MFDTIRAPLSEKKVFDSQVTERTEALISKIFRAIEFHHEQVSSVKKLAAVKKNGSV